MEGATLGLEDLAAFDLLAFAPALVLLGSRTLCASTLFYMNPKKNHYGSMKMIRTHDKQR